MTQRFIDSESGARPSIFHWLYPHQRLAAREIVDTVTAALDQRAPGLRRHPPILAVERVKVERGGIAAANDTRELLHLAARREHPAVDYIQGWAHIAQHAAQANTEQRHGHDDHQGRKGAVLRSEERRVGK